MHTLLGYGWGMSFLAPDFTPHAKRDCRTDVLLCFACTTFTSLAESGKVNAKEEETTVKFMGCTRCFLRQDAADFEGAMVDCNMKKDKTGHVLKEFEDAAAVSKDVKKIHMHPCTKCPDAKFYNEKLKPNMKLAVSAVSKTCRNKDCEMHTNYARELEKLPAGKAEGTTSGSTQLSYNARYKAALKRLPPPAQAEYKRMYTDWKEQQEAADDKRALLDVIETTALAVIDVEDEEPVGPDAASESDTRKGKRAKTEK